MNLKHSIWWVAGSLALTAICIIVTVTATKQMSTKLYKRSLKRTPIDFDALGPEIVRKKDIERKA